MFVGYALNVLKESHLSVALLFLSFVGAKLLINGLCLNATIRLLDLKVRLIALLPTYQY